MGRGKEMVNRITKLICLFEGLDFTGNRAEGDDLLGDVYDTAVINHFAVYWLNRKIR